MSPPAQAFEEIYSHHLDFVWRSLRRLGVGEAHLDDATQEAFLVVHRRLDDFEGRSSLRTWVYGTARRVAADFRRKGAGEVAPLTEAIEDQGADPFDLAAKREGMALLWSLLEEMSPERREVLVLNELEELSGPEIAEVLDLDLENVYGRIRRARAQFQEVLRRHEARVSSERALYRLRRDSHMKGRDRRRVAALLALSFPQLAGLHVAKAAPLGLGFKLSMGALALAAATVVLWGNTRSKAADSALPAVSQEITSSPVERTSATEEALPVESGTAEAKELAPSHVAARAHASRRRQRATVAKPVSTSKRAPIAAETVGAEPERITENAPAQEPQHEAQTRALADEAATLQRALIALQAGRLNDAEAGLKDYQRRHPEGQLRTEAAQMWRRLRCVRNYEDVEVGIARCVGG